MRLPQLPNGEIDEAQALLMVDEAMRGGINYYDTAWGYHNGKSEPFMGKVLARYPRESFFLATKFPGYALENFGRATEIFEEQLQRCGVSYFDFITAREPRQGNKPQGARGPLDRAAGTASN